MTSVPPLSSRERVSLTALALLNERERHPYDMQREIRLRQKDFVAGLPHSLYRAIERLTRDELIEPAETTREGNRPERTVYRITDEGRQEFYSRIGQLISAPALDSPSFAVALSFAGYFPDTSILHALTARVPQLEGEIAGLSAVSQLAGAHVQRVALLEQEYLHAIRVAELKWTKSVIEDLRFGRLTWDSAAAIHDPTSLVNNDDTKAERRGDAELRAIGDELPRRS
ncbi:MAG: PadR family transcriptional regulator [Pseudonocardiales bacterium]|nr:PadR family transcriptional regulator [Pseudonocardiales bacterium]MBV9729401.1 PadR family transcriptional regulator [Pseudonocardiales bacterium]